MASPPLWQFVIKLLPTVLLGALAMDIYVPCIPCMPAALQTDAAHIQLTLGSYMAGIAFGQIFCGPISDRFGRRLSLLLGLTLYCLASSYCSIATSVNLLILCRLLQGIGACACQVSAFAIARDSIPGPQQATVFSYFSGAIGLAPVLAPLLGGYLLLWTGTWRTNFVFLTVFSLLNFIMLFFTLKETLNPNLKVPFSKQIFVNYSKIVRDKNFLAYAFCAACGMTALFLFFSLSPIILIQQLGVPEHRFGYYFGLNALCMMIASFSAPALVPRFQYTGMLMLGMGLMAVGATVMTIGYFIFGLSIWGLIGPMLIASTGVGLTFGPTAAGALQNYPHMAGMATAMMGLIRFSIPFVLGTLVMQLSFASALPLGIIMLVLSCSSMLITRAWAIR